ncbi:MAG: hypothetical protein ACO4CW_02705 [Planctomycetota bacterium]
MVTQRGQIVGGAPPPTPVPRMLEKTPAGHSIVSPLCVGGEVVGRSARRW